MRFAFVVTLMAVALASCQGTTSRSAAPGEYDPRYNSYFQDPRTKLCFAVSVYDRTDIAGKTASGMSHTNVPCTAEVLQLLTPLTR